MTTIIIREIWERSWQVVVVEPDGRETSYGIYATRAAAEVERDVLLLKRALETRAPMEGS